MYVGNYSKWCEHVKEIEINPIDVWNYILS